VIIALLWKPQISQNRKILDLVKLFELASDAAPQKKSDCAAGVDIGLVEINTIDSGNTELVLAILKNSFKFSRAAWLYARRSDFSTIGAWPDDKSFARNEGDKACEENVKQFLNLMVIGHFGGNGAESDYESSKCDLLRAKSPIFDQVLIRLAALTSCEVGTSALE